MKQYLSFAFVLLAACGDNHELAPDAPPHVPPTVDGATDATACDASDYPQTVRHVSVDLGANFDLALDGQGARCDQIIRALTDPDPSKRPPELAELDVVGVTGSCTHDDTLNIDVVRLQGPEYGGLPLYAPVQDVLVHVGHPLAVGPMPATVVYLHGDFLAAGAPAPNAACLDDAGVRTALAGKAMTYSKFNACTYVGDSTYTLASDDVLQLGDEGYFVDANSQLHRVRAVDAYLLASHVTDELANTDMFCCNGTTYDNCVGDRLFVDVITGEIVGEAQHCRTC